MNGSQRRLMFGTQVQPPGSRPTHNVARYFLAAVAVSAVVCLLVVGYESFRTNSSSEVSYLVTGDSVASEITYSTSDGSLHESSVSLPWQTIAATGAVASVVAQGDSRSHSISCRITSPNGALLATQTSSGPYATVKCRRSRTNH